MSGTPFEALAQLDRRLHEPARLAILAALSAYERADFLFLLRITGLAQAQLSAQLANLEAAGLVEIDKRFVDKKTQTLARLSAGGRQQLEGYWKEMEELHESTAAWRLQQPEPAPA
jgi:DNA-binding transcriptional ArsR family regulator